MNTHTVVLYMTTSNLEEAQKISKTLVEERLIACANILTQMESYYFWNDSIQCDKEIPVIMKTTEAQVNAVTKRIRELHSYELPCLVALPIIDGNNKFIEWIREQTRHI